MLLRKSKMGLKLFRRIEKYLLLKFNLKSIITLFLVSKVISAETLRN